MDLIRLPNSHSPERNDIVFRPNGLTYDSPGRSEAEPWDTFHKHASSPKGAR